MTKFKQFAWVPDGIYDYEEYCVRYVIVEGNYTICISRTWVDKGGPNSVSLHLKQPWGSFPNFPPKPPKK